MATPAAPLCSSPFSPPPPQHKKLVEGNLYEEVSMASYSENDISNSIKNGILYLEDPIDHVSVWLRPLPPRLWRARRGVSTSPDFSPAATHPWAVHSSLPWSKG